MTLPNTSAMLLQTLNNLDAHRVEAEAYLQKLGADAVLVLRTAMRSGNVHERVNAIRLLERTNDMSVISDLLALQFHEHTWVRMTAAKALGSFRHWSATSGLLDWLQDEQDGMVKVWIVTSLGRLGDAYAVPALINALPTAESEIVVYTIIRALGVLGGEAVTKVIQPYTADTSSHVRRHAEDALAEIQSRMTE